MAENKMPVPTKAEIVSALSRTGFIFEHRVAQVLREHYLDPSLNYTYTDPQSSKSREIDIVGARHEDISSGDIDINIDVELVVECKNNTTPFVLIGETNTSTEFALYPVGVEVNFDPLRLGFPDYPSSILFLSGLRSVPGLPARDEFLALIIHTAASLAWDSRRPA